MTNARFVCHEDVHGLFRHSTPMTLINDPFSVAAAAVQREKYEKLRDMRHCKLRILWDLQKPWKDSIMRPQCCALRNRRSEWRTENLMIAVLMMRLRSPGAQFVRFRSVSWRWWPPGRRLRIVASCEACIRQLPPWAEYMSRNSSAMASVTSSMKTFRFVCLAPRGRESRLAPASCDWSDEQ